MLDRNIQLHLLKKMESTYPEFYDFNNDYNYGTDEYKKAITNLYYLYQHNLVEERSIMSSLSIDGIKRPQFNLPTINQNGMDFLADDGGLSAILGVVTVKFEAEQLKAILESRIMASDLPTPDKNKLIAGLQSLSAESIKHLTMKVLDSGWDNLGQLIHSIQSNLF